MKETSLFEHLQKEPVLWRLYSLTYRLFGVNTAMISADGSCRLSLASQENTPRFCRLLQSMGGLPLCLECDRKHIQQAMGQQQTLCYVCHVGLREFIIPINIENRPVAYILGGQVLDTHPDRDQFNKATQSLKKHGIDNTLLWAAYCELPVLKPSQQQDMMTLLDLQATYIAHTKLRFTHADAAPVDRARRFIRDHFSDELSANEIAEAARTSSQHLNRLLRAATGQSIHETLWHARVAGACDRLATTDESCLTIAMRCGFGTVQQFNRVFRRLKGCTPMEWRKTRVAALNESGYPHRGSA